MHTQRKQLGQVAGYVRKHGLPLIIQGDLFDRSVPGSAVLNLFLEFVNLLPPNSLYVYAGNHDLPYHSWDQVESSAFGTLWRIIQSGTGKIGYPEQFGQVANWGTEFTGEKTGLRFLHRLVFPDTASLPPNVNATVAPELLHEFPDDQWVFVGDYHHKFHYQWNGRHVVNPGCLNVQSADMIGYKPSMYLVDTDTGVLEELFITDDSSLLTDAYIQQETAREDRIQQFVSGIKTTGEFSLDFEKNVECEMLAADLSPAVEQQIRELMEALK
jgi:hypothetical protein